MTNDLLFASTSCPADEFSVRVRLSRYSALKVMLLYIVADTPMSGANFSVIATDEMLYEIWEQQMDSTAAEIYNSRSHFLESFIPVFRRFYSEISSQNESADLIYTSHLAESPLLPQLKSTRQRDLILGYTSRGIHRDDMEMMLGDYPMKRIGSQGQCKTYLIALKLAQYDFLQGQGETAPILLLDDIFDKLDTERVKQIIKLVSSDHFGQIFITDTNRKYLDEIIQFIGSQYHIFAVNRGEFTLLEESLP